MDNQIELKKVFGSRLRDLRVLRKGLTQGQCAEALGLESSKYNKWENGIACPDAFTVRRLAEFFGTSTDYLLGKVDMIDGDNIDAGKVTGLPEAAIERLRQMKDMGYIDMLDTMIFSEHMIAALSQLEKIGNPSLVEGYHAIVPKADFDAIAAGGNSGAMIVPLSVIEGLFTSQAKEEMLKLIDEMAKAIHDKKTGREGD